MTTAMSAAVECARSLVGDGYIYGATGWTCTPARREAQAKQYPLYADTILGTGAKWDGKRCWDCAQATKKIAKAAGVELPSGATSQWTKVAWARKGTIDTLPQGEACFLYREKGTKMQHTGFALGDGMFIHAKGTRYGVLCESLSAYPWTHWASPWGQIQGDDVMDDYRISDEQDTQGEVVAEVMRVTSGDGNPVKMRAGASTQMRVLSKLPVGTLVGVGDSADGWTQISHDGMQGWMMSKFLAPVTSSEIGTVIAPTGKEPTVTERLAALEQRVSELEEAMA